MPRPEPNLQFVNYPNIARLVIRSVFILLFLSLVTLIYYYPRISAASVLTSTKTDLMLYKNAVVENRGSWTQLYSLDVNSTGFTAEKSNLIAAVDESAKKGTEVMAKDISLPRVVFSKGAGSVIGNIRREFPELQDKGQAYFEDQAVMLEAVRQIDGILGKVLEYEPGSDLAMVRQNGFDKERVLEGISLARNGLGSSADALKEKKLNIPEVDGFVKAQQDFDIKLAEFSGAVSGGNEALISQRYRELNAAYAPVRTKAFMIYRAMIESDKGKKVLAEGGLLLEGLDKLIGDIEREQEKLINK